MTFETTQVIRLVAWICLFLYETYSMTREDVNWYNEGRSKRLPRMLQFPPIIFPLVWFVLKALLITSHYFYYEYASDFTYWTFIAVTVCTLVNTLLMKGWPVLFFGMRRSAMSLANAYLLVITSVLTVVFMGLSEPALGPMYWLPLILYILYPCWLIVALIVNSFWYLSEAIPNAPLGQPLIRKRVQQ